MSQQLPEILSISTLAKTKLFEIQGVDLRFSNGELRTYERFKPASRAGVMVLPIDGDELIMVKEYAVGTERYELGFVKGLMDMGETMEESANRELQEEIGLSAKEFVFLRTVQTSVGFMNAKMHILLAKDFSLSKLEGDEPEPLQILRYPLAKLDELLKNPDFYEARNLTALYCLRDYLAKS